MSAAGQMPGAGLTLGIDTATLDTVAGVCTAAAEPLVELIEGPRESGRPRHAEALLRLVERAVEAAGGWDAVGLIAVGVGPGSFTGIRVGVTTARALSQARSLPIVPVRSSAALAAGIEAGEGRAAIAVLDARRGEVFAERAPAEGRSGGPDGDPVLAAPDALGEALGPIAGALLAGEGAIRFRRDFEAAGAEVAPDPDPVHRIAARHVCALGLGAEPGRPEDVKPMYLREPDAERWRERD